METPRHLDKQIHRRLEQFGLLEGVEGGRREGVKDQVVGGDVHVPYPTLQALEHGFLGRLRVMVRVGARVWARVTE